MKDSPRITIGLVSYNRCDSVCRAIESAVMQQPPVPIIFVNNASTDDTLEQVTARFGDRVQVIDSKTNDGPVPARQRILELSTTPYVFYLDDDAYLQSPDTMNQVVADLEADSSIAVVAAPYLQEGQLLHAASDPTRIQLTHMFGNMCCAFRKDAILAVGGYRLSMRMYAEEMDIALRLTRAGYVIRRGTSDPPAVHCPHPDRSSMAQQRYRHQLNATNTFLCVWRYFPLLHVPVVFKGMTRQLWVRRKPAVTLPIFVGSIVRALLACARQTFSRRPLTTRQYLHWCRCARGEVFLDHPDGSRTAADARPNELVEA